MNELATSHTHSHSLLTLVALIYIYISLVSCAASRLGWPRSTGGVLVYTKALD